MLSKSMISDVFDITRCSDAGPCPRASIAAAARAPRGDRRQEVVMAKKSSSDEGVYRIVDVVGVSEVSWEDAGRQAIKTAAKSLRDLRIAEVTKMDMKVEDGKVVAFRTRVALSFKYES
jgi:flavin-binding protein dodecin